MIETWLTTNQAAEKYGIKPATVRGAIRRGEFPTRLVDGKVHLFEDSTPKFQSWLARCQKRIAAMQAPTEATTARQQYHRHYYEEHIKPKRQAMRDAVTA